MATNYHRGRAKEYKAMGILKGAGWFCTRSAMSHGPVDIVAARKGRIRLIQVKSGSAKATIEEIKTLRKWAKQFNADAEVWSFKKNGHNPEVLVVKRSRIASASSVKNLTNAKLHDRNVEIEKKKAETILNATLHRHRSSSSSPPLQTASISLQPPFSHGT
jgi:Holliday junction resolvase